MSANIWRILQDPGKGMENEPPLQYQKLVGDIQKYSYVVGVSAGPNYLGSGIVLAPNIVLTCYHVCKGDLELLANPLYVIAPSGCLEAEVKFLDQEEDLAILEVKESISSSGLSFISAQPRAGATVVAIGAQKPLSRADHPTIAEANLYFLNTNSAQGAVMDVQLQGGAPSGYSGGPIILKYGKTPRCIGIVRWGSAVKSAITSAIGPARIQAFIKESNLPENILRISNEGLSIGEAEVKKLEALAMRGDAEDQFQLALIYHDRTGAHYRPKDAAEWFRSAADQGHAESAFCLARCYQMGEGLLRNEPEAAFWYRRSAELSYPDGQLVWGKMLLDGRAGERNFKLAADFFDRSAKKGNLEARYQLAMLQLEGFAGMPRNEFKAYQGFLEVAESGRPDAQFELALMLANGHGVPADMAQALRWAQAAAEQGHREAANLVEELEGQI